MKVLVIPDVHLKPWMFERAADLMRQGYAQRAVCLMDIADDWNRQWDLALYERTYDAAIAFAKEFPDTLWCYGNHDICYVWNRRESGYSPAAAPTVIRKLEQLQAALQDRNQLAFVQRIDNVLFSHGGLSDAYVMEKASAEDGPDAVIAAINALSPDDLWESDSPLWWRPYQRPVKMYADDTFLQVSGHTPVPQIRRLQNLVLCDVFSTYPDGRKYGSGKFTVVDTLSFECKAVKQAVRKTNL